MAFTKRQITLLTLALSFWVISAPSGNGWRAVGENNNGGTITIGANFSNKRTLNRLSRLKFAPIGGYPSTLFALKSR